MNIYDFKVKTIDGEETTLEKYKGKVLVVVNTASKCGFTPQYSDLENIYKKYKDMGLEILGFPCNQFAEQEPGNSNDVKAFCQLNYGVTFPLFEKVDVKGQTAHPLFKFLSNSMPFNGFDLSTPSGRLLDNILKEKYPEYIIGNSIKWNFTKFLIDRDGNIVNRFESPVDPMDMIPEIEKIL